MEDNQQLLRRIEKLEKEIQGLKQSSTIPYEIERALSARGFVLTEQPDQPPYTDWIDNPGFAYEPELGVYVQTAATQYLKYKGQGGRDYFIPLLGLDETV